MKTYKKIITVLRVLLVANVSFAQTDQTGSIRHYPGFRSRLVLSRNIDVYLPAGYHPSKKYSVVYMHDGQNLFDSSHSYIKVEWKIDETIDSLIKVNAIQNCVIVGIWNTKQRFSEYWPTRPYQNLAEDIKSEVPGINGPSLADNYLRFIIEELKPFIDSAFGTLRDRKHTFIAGSSMGGLISLYAICEYPKVFGGAACLSTHWPAGLKKGSQKGFTAMLDYLEEKLPSPRTHKVYFDYGNKTLDTLYEPYQGLVDKVMRARGYNERTWVTKEYVGHDHSERSWQKRVHVPFLFLLGKRQSQMDAVKTTGVPL